MRCAGRDHRGRLSRDRYRAWPTAAVILCAAVFAHAAGADEKQVIGWIERVLVSAERLAMDAKVDTGADNTSVHAEQIQYFERDGRRWVAFTLRGEGGVEHRLQRPLERIAMIKKKTSGFQERPVVSLQLCVGTEERTVSVNLAQRAHFRYPLLLGRSFLEGRYLVDSGQKFLLAPACAP